MCQSSSKVLCDTMATTGRACLTSQCPAFMLRGGCLVGCCANVSITARACLKSVSLALNRVLLQAAVQMYGHNWAAVAAEVGTGRAPSQVMHHFKNVMRMLERKTGPWSPDEDMLLVQVTSSRHGGLGRAILQGQ